MHYFLFPFPGLWSLSDCSLELDYSLVFSCLVGPAVWGRQPLVQYHCSHCRPPPCRACRRQSWECDSRTDSNKIWLWNKWHKLNFKKKDDNVFLEKKKGRPQIGYGITVKGDKGNQEQAKPVRRMRRGKVNLHAGFWFSNSAPREVSSRHFTCIRNGGTEN